ncbi:uncharacterized protein LOC143294357 [Babylonia areolata]|uniref:uncharacterized protein LOC143294357 n=1 Tax=Babylonia areolata TaxID=304850 RepID=UPI003FD4651F
MRDAEGVITFFINGERHSVNLQSGQYSAKSRLIDYIRLVGLTGTKLVCREAGCGACAVSVTVPDALKPDLHSTRTICSCLCPLFSVDGWQITTVEALGNEKEGYHPIQQRLAKANGSQCGFCTPGVVMSMYGLLLDKPAPTQQDIEDNFDGNLCRCTGYRAILDSMKSFGIDSDVPDGGVIDIEDLNRKVCPKSGRVCTGKGAHKNKAAPTTTAAAGTGDDAKTAVDSGTPSPQQLQLCSDTGLWIRPLSLGDLGRVMQEHSDARVRLVFGNTAAGIYKAPADVFIDISCIRELSFVKLQDKGVQIGANLTLSALITHLASLQTSRPGFAYFEQLIQHLKSVGSVLLRNAASIGGNLYIKYAQPGFPSDLFTMFEAACASVSIYDCEKSVETVVPLGDLLKEVDMTGKVLTSLYLPELQPLECFRSFKVAPRSQSAFAYVNAAFKIKMAEDGKHIVGQPSFVFGGIDDKLVHAKTTEQFFAGKEITTQLIKDGLSLLKSELQPSSGVLLAPPEYRRDLAASLLYKMLLGLVAPSDPRLASGASSLQRPVSVAEQTFQEKREDWPLKQPMPKKTALLQTSGEAIFVNDLPSFQHELHAAFVLSTVACAEIESVDPTPALELPGVVRYISAQDIPAQGKNMAYPWTVHKTEAEEILSSGKITYAGQPIGVIVAESQLLANEAARRVAVKYRDVQQPVLSIQQGIAANSFHPCSVDTVVVGDAEGTLGQADNTVEGEVNMGTQYHFYLESQISLCVPSEDGVDLYCSTQYGDMVQANVASFLGQSANYVNMFMPRVGGAFGGKQESSMFPAAAAALAATCTGRPVRMSLSLSDNMAFAGKRFPVLAKYKAGFTGEGKLQAVIVDVYIDGGHTFSCNSMLHEVVMRVDNGYYSPNWKIRPFNVKTNKPTNVACRSPGPVPASLIMETILEHMAKTLNKHPIMVKEINLYEKHQTDMMGHVLSYCTLNEVWSRLKTLADVESRIAEVQTFNQLNQWKKRGLTMNAIKHGMFWDGTGFPAQVTIFASDGTVVISQSGTEMGQGLYTKVAQAAAHTLGIPMDLVKVRPNQSVIANNAMISGGSTTSEQCVYAVQQCCKTLLERMAPVKAQHPDADWPTLCRKALQAKVDLGARYTYFGGGLASPIFTYFTYCAGVFETEVDVLTGEYLVRRVDILFDCGESLNALIDVGQIEGAFIMGLGHYLMEDIIYDTNSGRVLNGGTWGYHLPTSKDIPVDWRIHLLPDAPNPVGITSAKAVGEPPIALGCGPLLALRQAMEEAVYDLTGSPTFVTVECPFTVDKIQQGCKTDTEHLRL